MRQLAPESSLIRFLNAQPPPGGPRVTSFVAGRDALIQPIDAAGCPFGAVRRFDELGHVELLFAPRVFAAVRRTLRQE